MTEKPIFVSGGHKYYVAYFQNGNLIIRGNKNPLNQFVIYLIHRRDKPRTFKLQIPSNQMIEWLKYGSENRKYESEERIVFNVSMFSHMTSDF